MITSLQNERIKQWKKLQRRRDREKQQRFLIEGFHLIEEAVSSEWEVEQLILREDISLPNELQSLPQVRVSESVFNHLAETYSPQGVIGVVKIKETSGDFSNHILLLDAIQDPGNLGTIIRTADAAGFSTVILGRGTVDPYNDKVIRATQGSLFHLPIIQKPLDKAIDELNKKFYKIAATGLSDQSITYKQLKADQKTALILGNEGAGIDPQFIEQADTLVEIPIYGEAESLNVSVAAGILMYHLQT